MANNINAPVILRFVLDDGQAGSHYDFTLNTSVFNWANDWHATATPLYTKLVNTPTFVSARFRLIIEDKGYATPNQIYPYNPAPKVKIHTLVGKFDLAGLQAFSNTVDALWTTAINLATPF